MANMMIGQSLIAQSSQTLYASRMNLQSPSADESEAGQVVPATMETAQTPAPSASLEMSLAYNVSLQLHNAQIEEAEEFSPELRPHGRGSMEHLGKELEREGHQLGKTTRRLAEELDLDKSDRAELRNMVKDLKHDLKDAFRRAENTDDHDHREHAARPDADTAIAAATEAFAVFTERLQSFTDRVLGVEDEAEDEIAAEPSLLPVEPLVDGSKLDVTVI